MRRPTKFADLSDTMAYRKDADGLTAGDREAQRLMPPVYKEETKPEDILNADALMFLKKLNDNRGTEL